MILRTSKLSKTRSFFLFGPRGTGKSTLLKAWAHGISHRIINLLDPQTEGKYKSNPQLLLSEWKESQTEWIVIDEIQKVPELLNVAHQGIVDHKIKFALTGSSARKIRKGSANLAFEFHLHPFTHLELGENFHLGDALTYGSLPEILSLEKEDKIRMLYGYVSTYLKEEILVEQIVRKIDPFRRFLEVAAQMNGQILNYSKISRDANVEVKSVARYFQILDDTLVGFFLEPYSSSIRKRQSKKSKFYFFDTGITRALDNTAVNPLTKGTTEYGRIFEQFFILECIRLNDAFEKRYRFSYLRTKDDLEIDLIIERPGQSNILIEIKSSDKPTLEFAHHLLALKKAFKNSELWIISQVPEAYTEQDIRFLPWKKALKMLFE